MDNVLSVASYLVQQYCARYGRPLDEMKIHKLLYFAQRESFIQFDEPLFDATFFGWKYGPVLKEIRRAYSDGAFSCYNTISVCERTQLVIAKVLGDYAEKDSWSLSRLTHGELSWRKSRAGVPEEASSDYPMDNNDIKLDAARIKERRTLLSNLGLG